VARLEGSTLQRFSFALLIGFLFMIFSRVFDVQLYWLHLPGISYRLMAVFLFMSGTFLIALRDSIGKCVLAFTACFLAAIPFSVWRTGSFHTLTEQWLVGCVVFMATAALIADFGQYVRSAKTVAIALLVLTFICLIFGSVQNGRLFLERGRFANPNEMAQALLLGLPFWWAIYTNSSGLFSKLFGAGAMAAMVFVIGKTGSRGALISILVVLAFMFLRASALGKMKLLFGAGMLLLIAVVVLPGALRARYQTFFNAEPMESYDGPEVDPDILGSAVTSTSNRMEMLVRSLVLTAKHPLLGVGPGMFPVAENDLARSEGKRGAWLGTHNSFTEVSSECGIPAFLLYAAILLLSLKKSYALYRRTKGHPQWKEISTHALALNYSLIAFFVTGIFVHAAYTSLLPVLSGLTVSLVRTAEPLLAAGPDDGLARPAPAKAPAYRGPLPRFSPARSA
jgi:O-antigen ligase